MGACLLEAVTFSLQPLLSPKLPWLGSREVALKRWEKRSLLPLPRGGVDLSLVALAHL